MVQAAPAQQVLRGRAVLQRAEKTYERFEELRAELTAMYGARMQLPTRKQLVASGRCARYWRAACSHTCYMHAHLLHHRCLMPWSCIKQPECLMPWPCKQPGLSLDYHTPLPLVASRQPISEWRQWLWCAGWI
jgi:hypothetical protein